MSESIGVAAGDDRYLGHRRVRRQADGEDGKAAEHQDHGAEDRIGDVAAGSVSATDDRVERHARLHVGHAAQLDQVATRLPHHLIDVAARLLNLHGALPFCRRRWSARGEGKRIASVGSTSAERVYY